MPGNKRKAERKPLSFSTTMRNPERIAGFLDCILPFENQTLTSNIIAKIVKNVLNRKFYKTMYQARNPHLNAIFFDEDAIYTDEQIEEIKINAPQRHKEYGFEEGWDSRFDTWYKLPMELGFLSYEMNQPIKISNTGHMLIDAFKETPVNERKIQNVFLNALMKYQSNNPYRKNLNSNVPLLLLLQVINLLKKDETQNGAGVSRQEISFFICWQNNNAQSLYHYIKSFRDEFSFSASDEIVYKKCLKLLESDNEDRFKKSQICGEAVDEYIRKMRCTGIISLRGNGRFIDFNTFEINRINYVLEKYSTYSEFTEIASYYEYMGNIDETIIEIAQTAKTDLKDLRKQTLKKFASEYTKKEIYDELKILCNKNGSSKNPVLKYINEPTRLEFLTSIALVQQFENLDVNPNYSIDDEGLPTFTASGGIADILCYDTDFDSLFEVTLMCGRQDQVNNEIIPIRRHLLEHKKEKDNSFSVFIAPKIHEDTKESAAWYKHKDKIDIITYDIPSFIIDLPRCEKCSNLLKISSN